MLSALLDSCWEALLDLHATQPLQSSEAMQTTSHIHTIDTKIKTKSFPVLLLKKKRGSNLKSYR